jgi:hypothetical protein
MFCVRLKSKVLLFVASLWFANAVQAQAALRPEVASQLQAAQVELTAKNYAAAVTQAKTARSVPNLTTQERSAIERILATASINAKDYKAAIDSLTYLSTDTALSGSDRLAYMEALIALLRAQQDFVNLAQTTRAYLDQGGKKEGLRALYVQTLSVLNSHQAVIDYLSPLLKSTPAVSLGEPELRVLAIAYKSLQDNSGYYNTLKQLTAAVPSNKDYWKELLTQLQKQTFFNPRYELDVFRIMLHKQVLNEADAYLYGAHLAVKHGLPAEALQVLDAGLEAKAFVSEQDKANQQKLRGAVSKKVSEDEKQIPVLAKSNKGQDQAELAEILFSKGDYKGAIAKYEGALQASVLRREPELRLHLLIAMLKSGMSAQAHKQLEEIKTDTTARELGLLWTAWN